MPLTARGGPVNVGQLKGLSPDLGGSLTPVALPFTKFVLCAVITLAVAACDALPRGAPVEREVVEAASGEIADFAVYPVTRALVPVITEWPRTGERNLSWIPTSGGARTQVIASGD